MVGKHARQLASIAGLYALSGCGLGQLVPITPPQGEEPPCDLYETSRFGKKLVGADCDGNGIDLVLTENEDSATLLANGERIDGHKAERVTEEFKDQVIGNVQVFTAGELNLAREVWREYLESKAQAGPGSHIQPLSLYMP